MKKVVQFKALILKNDVSSEITNFQKDLEDKIRKSVWQHIRKNFF